MGAGERAKDFLRAAFPGGVRAYRRLRAAAHARGVGLPDKGAVFSAIYRDNGWGDPESVSGRGSTLAHTAVIRRELPALLAALGARSLLDAPCGDFNWMRHVDLGGVEYFGADVVAELVARNRREHGRPGRTFVVADLTRDRLPAADAVLCRDCFIHLSLRDIRRAVVNFKRSGARYLLATTHARVGEYEDIPTGGWRSVNLQLPPFDFPAPLRLVVENEELGKCLGVWRLDELPVPPRRFAKGRAKV